MWGAGFLDHKHSFKAKRLALISAPSSRLSLVSCPAESFLRSDPAKSHKVIENGLVDPPLMEMRTCPRLEELLAFVPAVLRRSCPVRNHARSSTPVEHSRSSAPMAFHRPGA